MTQPALQNEPRPSRVSRATTVNVGTPTTDQWPTAQPTWYGLLCYAVDGSAVLHRWLRVAAQIHLEGTRKRLHAFTVLSLGLSLVPLGEAQWPAAGPPGPNVTVTFRVGLPVGRTLVLGGGLGLGSGPGGSRAHARDRLGQRRRRLLKVTGRPGHAR